MMELAQLHLVVDTNTLIRALANTASASGRIVRACEARRVRLLLSRPVLREYREVLMSEAITSRHSDVTPRAVELVL